MEMQRKLGGGDVQGRVNKNKILKIFRQRDEEGLLMSQGCDNKNSVKQFSGATLSGSEDSWLPSVRRICTDLLQSCPVSCKL